MVPNANRDAMEDVARIEPRRDLRRVRDLALILTVGVALRQLLDPSEFTQIPTCAGAIIAMTLIGWALGGMTAGILADYIGRKRTMILAILTYSLVTGLSAFAWDFTSFAVMRFLVGLAIGSEWVTGTSMTAEIWPDHARGRGACLFQCGFGIGFFLASFVWLLVGATGPGAWRTMYLIRLADPGFSRDRGSAKAAHRARVMSPIERPPVPSAWIIARVARA
jgi:MFS family permease